MEGVGGRKRDVWKGWEREEVRDEREGWKKEAMEERKKGRWNGTEERKGLLKDRL